MVGFVDVGAGDCAVGVCAYGGFDMVFGGGEDAGECECGCNVFWSDEEGVVVCIWGFG